MHRIFSERFQEFNKPDCFGKGTREQVAAWKSRAEICRAVEENERPPINGRKNRKKVADPVALWTGFACLLYSEGPFAVFLSEVRDGVFREFRKRRAPPIFEWKHGDIPGGVLDGAMPMTV